MFNKKNFFLVLAIILILIATNFCNVIGVNQNISNESEIITQNSIKKWTLLYYNCCDRNHTSYENENLITELKQIGSSNDLNIIAIVDGEYDDDTVIYYIEPGNAIRLNELIGWPSEANLADPVVLKSYLNFVVDQYPAEYYAMIILSDMGSGWMGILHDDEAPLMSIPTFAKTFEELQVETGEKIDILALRPCVMGSFEVSYELKDGVDFFIASEDHMLEPLDKGVEYIFPYYQSTWYLKNNTDITPEHFAEKIVDFFNPTDFPLWVLYTYEVIYKKGNMNPFLKIISNVLTKFLNKLPNPDYHTTGIYTTLSATNLSRIDNVAKKIDVLSEKLILYSFDEDTINVINDARLNVREFAKFYSNNKNRLTSTLSMIFSIEKFAYDSFVDLYDLIRQINESSNNEFIKQACEDVMIEFNNAIIVNSSTDNDHAYGLHIYFPEEKDQYNRYLWKTKMPCLYEELDFAQNTHWDEFLKNYLDI